MRLRQYSPIVPFVRPREDMNPYVCAACKQPAWVSITRWDVMDTHTFLVTGRGGLRNCTHTLYNNMLRCPRESKRVRCFGRLQFPETLVFLDYLEEHPPDVPPLLLQYVRESLRGYMNPLNRGTSRRDEDTHIAMSWIQDALVGNPVGTELLHAVCRGITPKSHHFSHVWTRAITAGVVYNIYDLLGDG